MMYQYVNDSDQEVFVCPECHVAIQCGDNLLNEDLMDETHRFYFQKEMPCLQPGQKCDNCGQGLY